MQFKVPQNIDMADRIVGPLTLVQFLYLLFGGIIIYTLFNVVAPINKGLFLALALPIALFCLALAFLKVQDQPFPRFVAAFFVYLAKPKSRIWAKVSTQDVVSIVPDEALSKQTVDRKTIHRSQLEQLAQTLDTAGQVAPRQAAAPAPFTPPNYLKRGRPVLDNVSGATHG